MTYPQRLLISISDDQLVALEQIADQLTRAGYQVDARHVVEDILTQLFMRPDLLTQLLRMLAEREEIQLTGQ